MILPLRNYLGSRRLGFDPADHHLLHLGIGDRGVSGDLVHSYKQFISVTFCSDFNDLSKKRPGCGQTNPRCRQTNPRCGQTDPGCEQTNPGCDQANPGCGQTHPGCGQTSPGYEQTHPGCGHPEVAHQAIPARRVPLLQRVFSDSRRR